MDSRWRCPPYDWRKRHRTASATANPWHPDPERARCAHAAVHSSRITLDRRPAVATR